MLFACVVWLGWVLLQTHGATIIARSPVTDVLDGTIQRTQMLTVRCTGADYGTVTSFNLTDANGVARQMNVTCGEVAYRYQMTVVGYVPRDGTMYVREYCELQQLAANNTVQDLLATRAVTTGTGARRRLLFAWAPVAANALLSVGGGMAGAEIICNLGQACGGGGGSINMDDVVKRVRNDMSAELNRLQALNAFQSATQAWENNVDNSLNHTYSSILGLQNVTEILGASLGRTQTDLAGAQGEIKRLTLLTSANFNSSQQNILDVRTYVDNLTSSIGIDTRAEFNRSYLNANRIETDTKTAINTLSNRLESIVTTLLSNQRASFKTARDLATAVRKLAVRYQATRALTRLLLDVIDLAHNAGLTPFVGNLGTHSQDTSGVLAPAIEVVQFTYFTNITGVGVRAFWVRMTYSCNALYLLNNLGGWYSWRDFLETIGPTGCDPNSDVNGVGCSCTMSVEQLQCDSSSAGVASVNFTSGQSLNSIVCGANPVITTAPARVYSDPSAFLSNMSSLCVTVGDRTGVNMAAVTNKRKVNFSNPIASCVISSDDLEAAPNGTSIMFATMAFLEVAVSQWALLSDQLIAYYDGRMPSDITFRDFPFVQRASSSGTCTQATMMAFSTDLLPVYRLDPVAVDVSVSVSVTGLTGVTSSDAILSYGITSVLPSGGDVVVGDPRSNTTIYNIPFYELPLSAIPASREGSVLYAMMPNSTSFSMAQWKAVYPSATFDHTQAGEVAQLYATAVNTSDGTCFNNPAVGQLSSSGAWCDVRAFYSVRKVPGNDTQLAAVPRGSDARSSYLVTISVPDGALTLNVVSLCPTVSFSPAGLGTLVTLTNVAAGGSRTRVNFTVGPAGCGLSFPSTEIAGGGSMQQLVPRCPSAPSLLYLSRYLGNGTTVPCPDAYGLDITTTSLQYTSEWGNADVAYVNFVSINATSNVVTAVTQVAQILQELLLNGVAAGFAATVSTNLTVDTTAYREFIAQSAAAAERIRRVMDGFQIPPYNNSDYDKLLEIINNNTAKMNENMNATQTQFRQAMNALDDAIKAQGNSLLDLNTSKVLLDKVRVLYLAAEQQATWARNNQSLAILDAFTQINDALQRPGDPLGNLFEDAGKGIWGVMKKSGSAIEDVAKFVADTAKGVVDGVTGGFFSGMMGIFSFVGIVVALACVVLLCCSQSKNIRKQLAKFTEDVKHKAVGNADSDDDDSEAEHTRLRKPKSGTSARSNVNGAQLQGHVQDLSVRLSEIADRLSALEQSRLARRTV